MIPRSDTFCSLHRAEKGLILIGLQSLKAYLNNANVPMDIAEALELNKDFKADYKNTWHIEFTSIDNHIFSEKTITSKGLVDIYYQKSYTIPEITRKGEWGLDRCTKETEWCVRKEPKAKKLLSVDNGKTWVEEIDNMYYAKPMLLSEHIEELEWSVKNQNIATKKKHERDIIGKKSYVWDNAQYDRSERYKDYD